MRKFFFVLFLCNFAFCFSETQKNRIEYSDNDKISILLKKENIYKNFYDNNQYFILQSYMINYCDEKLNMNVSYVLRDNEVRLIKKLDGKIPLNIDAASNISHIKEIFENESIFYSKENMIIKEYIRSVGNGWCTDDFGFLIQLKQGQYSFINIKIDNIYSTYIKKGEYPDLWNKRLVASYNDKENNGIKFYYLFEELIKRIVINNKTIQIIGNVNDDKVRFRKENNLHCETIRFFERGEQVQILDCDSELTIINNEKAPWIRIETKDGEVGYIFGKYLDIIVKL